MRDLLTNRIYAPPSLPPSVREKCADRLALARPPGTQHVVHLIQTGIRSVGDLQMRAVKVLSILSS